jgi:hypothetical protein
MGARAVGWLLLVGLGLGAGASSALAAPGLPRTYDVQRIDGPNPAVGNAFGGGAANVGDLNGDGASDFALGVRAGSAGGNGHVLVFSGRTGGLIDTIPAPDPGGAGTASALFGIPYVGTMPDVGSCPGRTTGELCTNPIAGRDGVPEIVIGARGVDVGGSVDVGRAYVYDGATRALMKRIDMPAVDRTASGLSSGGAWFGRVVVAPAGSPPCEGNGGVGLCPPVTDAVRIGDVDGGGAADLMVGASRYTETNATAHPASHCARTVAATCVGAGRAYLYRGEDVAGSDPGVILEAAFRTLRNPDAQADDPNTVDVTARRELFANAIGAVGDVGACVTPAVVPGDRCGATGTRNAPDGRPEILISGLRVDLPSANPDPAWVDVGVNYLVDGATGAILYAYQHPEPQAGAVLGSSLGGPAVGNLGDTPLPDVYLSAVTQNGRYQAEGRGYVMSGNVAAFSSTINFARLDDPTPSPSGNFGGGYSAVGNLVDQPGLFRNELLVGEGGLGEPGNEDLLGDVHFFDPVKAQALQSIPDPDQSPGSRFGADVVALGDLNGDGFLDFAVAAPNFNGSVGTGQGRLYVFRSDNSPAPAPASAPPAQVAPPPAAAPAPAPGLQPQQQLLPPRAAPAPRLAPRLRVVRARLRGRRLDVLVTLTGRATGRVSFRLRAAGRTLRFSQRIVRGRARVSRRVSRAQSRSRGAALTVRYAGNSRVRPATVRARVVRARLTR